MKSKRLVIGIVADVDAGKTTLSEGILFKTGIIKAPGRVDRGDAFLDRDEIERRRGITVFAKEACFSLGERKITLLDTPGHRDFSQEVRRSLSALDLALFLLDGSKDLSGHSLGLWKELESLGIPTFIFINKTDLPGFEKERAWEEVNRITAGAVEYQAGFNPESIAFSSDEALEIYEKKGKLDEVDIKRLIENRKLFPVIFGSALREEGMDELLKAIENYAPEKEYPGEFGALVYKIGRDEKGKKISYAKITGGELLLRSEINGEKITAIRVQTDLSYENRERAEAGEICLITGLDSAYSGMGIGEEDDIKVEMPKLITYEIILPEGIDYYNAYKSLKEFGEEFPELMIEAHSENRITMSLLGEVQQETIRELIKRNYGFLIEYGKPRVQYLETIGDKTFGAGHYEPLRHYAEVHLMMEPLERGRGIVIENAVSTDDLDISFIKSILDVLNNHSYKGVLIGAPLTDIKITLIAAKGHLKHTEGGDFREATIRAYRQGLMKANNILLEPYMLTSFSGPAELMGRVSSDIRRLKGEIIDQEMNENEFLLRAQLPLINFMDYQREYISLTGGKGQIESEFKGFYPCHNEDEVLDERAYEASGDLEYPADSVFCQRGAASLVNWKDADEMMHIKPFDDREREREREEEASSRPEVSIKELEAIFKMTYGEGNKPRPRPSKIINAEDNSKYKGKEAGINNSGPSHLLVDGYNVIFRWKELKELAESNMDAAREKLIGILANYGAYMGEKVTVVFDAYKNKEQSHRIMESLGVEIVFTKENETADTYIERAAFQLGKKERLRVATSDRLEQMNVFGSGALRISALELKNLIEGASEEIRNRLND